MRAHVIAAFLMACIHLSVGAQEVVIVPNRNVELLGIVYNAASGYTPEDDGYTLAPDAAYMKGSHDYREQYTLGEGNFLPSAPMAGVLQREFCDSDTPFFDFYPTLVARVAEILRKNEKR